ncbi:hypothetical protein E0L13_06220 [Megasphaera sp. SW808]|uniref:hypothetical protein n=1 Tax=Megasphaera sp. SW808 TaxID=2530045 RepID=UPI0014390CE1|nr:hypothetical protein [Megasphaera sp. SW808]NJE34607.1 hypothetical protein [Megasphaera sp. SW808]
MMNIIFDADMLLFVSLLACEKPEHWGNDIWTLHCDFNEAKVYLDNFVLELSEKVLNHYKAEDGEYKIFMCLTDKDHENFRNAEVWPEYKGNRKEARRPVCFNRMREYIKDTYVCYLEPHLEADDCAGLLTQDVEGDYVLVSGDKDFRAIPGKFYDFMRDKYYETSEEDAVRWHLYQTIIGDTTDNYKGAAGFGPVKAERLLEEYGYSWATVLKAYRGDEQEALKNARLAYILHRKGDYDWKTGSIRLWEPPSE